MATTGEKIKFHLKCLGRRPAWLAEEVGISRTAIGKIINDATGNSKYLYKIAEALGVSYGYLVDGNQPISESKNGQAGLGLDVSELGVVSNTFINIPIYNIELSAGNGYSAGHEAVTDEYPIHQSVLNKMGIDQQEAVIVKVRGESMTDTLWDGDMVLIQTTDKTPTSHKIYAFRLDDELRVKRFVKQLDGSWRVVSDNADKTLYPDEVISSHTASKLEILGRVRRIIDREM